MKSAKEIIDKILSDHDTIIENVRGTQRTASDKRIITELTADRDINGAGPLFGGAEGLRDLLQQLSARLNQHFNFEETGLLYAIREHGNNNISEAFSALFMEHEELRNQFTCIKNDAVALTNSGLSGEIKSAQLKDLRQRLIDAGNLLEVHAASEDRLLKELRNRL